MSLKELVGAYGYYVVFLSSIMEGETGLALGGVAAHRGYLDLFWVTATAFFGGWLGDQFFFFLGRRHGHSILARFPRLQPKAVKMTLLIEKYHTPIIIAVRFLYGLRTIGPMVIGMTTVSALRFMLLNAIGALIWAILIAAAGYAFSNAVEALLPEIKHYEEYLFLTVAIVSALLAFLSRLRRRRAYKEP